ncbi:hypothetical protein SCWH03_46110 [Streptomyces pacificus]|uniref:Uncharacterized protein n=1 Tax=Streptomyces pacificus TaxID=2705029 RepID=A0A6A0AZI2_9ACTN|nr:hypothetical protein SCWH03_46110 [Streptomyces pacificus]
MLRSARTVPRSGVGWRLTGAAVSAGEAGTVPDARARAEPGSASLGGPHPAGSPEALRGAAGQALARSGGAGPGAGPATRRSPYAPGPLGAAARRHGGAGTVSCSSMVLVPPGTRSGIRTGTRHSRRVGRRMEAAHGRSDRTPGR